MIDYEQEFENFLNENGALEQFYSYTELSSVELNYDDTVMYTFIWSSTPEGSDYWNNLSTLWDERLEALEHTF